MKKLPALVLAAILLFVLQQTLAVAVPEYGCVLVDNIWCDVATVGVSACDDDAEIDFRPAAMKISKKSHQFKKFYVVKNKINNKNQITINFYGIYFSAKSFFYVYSGEKAYLLTGGDERGSC